MWISSEKKYVEKIVIVKAETIEDVNYELRQAGKVIFTKNGLPIVICGEGLLLTQEAYLNDIDGDSYLPMKNFRVRFL
jgi:methionyl-tRNA formyltransferase